MTTVTFSVTDEQKRMIKTQAAFSGKTMKDFILEALGIIKPMPEYTSDDFNETTIAAMKEDLSNSKVYTSTEEMFTDILGDHWQNKNA